MFQFSASVRLGLFVGLALDAQISRYSNSHIRVVVDLVQLNVAVTDSRGNDVTAATKRFAATEDGIQQKISTFAEGNAPARRLADAPPNAKDVNGEPSMPAYPTVGQDGTHLTATELSSITAGANVFWDSLIRSDDLSRGFGVRTGRDIPFCSLAGIRRPESLSIRTVAICREQRG